MVGIALLIAIALTIYAYLKINNQQRKIRQQQAELKRFREHLCKGDRVRLGNGTTAEVIDTGKDFVFLASPHGVSIVNKKDVLPLILN